MLHLLLHSNDDRDKVCARLRRESLLRYNQHTHLLRCSGDAKIYWLCLEYLIHSRNPVAPYSHPSWLHRLWLTNSTLVQYCESLDSLPNHYHYHLVWTISESFERLLARAFHLSLREECHPRPRLLQLSVNLYQSHFEPSPRRVFLFLSHRSCFLCQLLSVLTPQVPLCLSIYHL